MSFRKFVLCAAVSFSASMAQADVVYDGGSSSHAGASPADLSTSASEGVQRISLASDITVNRMVWWGAYISTAPNGEHNPVSPGPDNFLLNFRSVLADGTPGAALHSLSLANTVRTATLDTHLGAGKGFGEPEYAYTADFSAITLAAGDYFVGLGNDYVGGDFWGWELTDEGQQMGSYTYSQNSGEWSQNIGSFIIVDANNFDYAFRLENTDLNGNGSVPEPGSLALAALGLAGLGLGRRRACK